MRLSVAPLLPAVRRVQQATTAAQRQDAAWALYHIATPLLTHRCEAVLRRYAPLHWQAPEDLAADTLLSLAEVPTRVHSCRASTAVEALSWLRGAAYRRLRGTPEARACRALGLRVVPLVDGMIDHLPASVATRAAEAHQAFRCDYAYHLRRLDPLDKRVWITCVEQEIPAKEVARDLGRTAGAVRRRVQRIAAHLRAQLAAYEPAQRTVRRSNPAPSPRERRAR